MKCIVVRGADYPFDVVQGSEGKGWIIRGVGISSGKIDINPLIETGEAQGIDAVFAINGIDPWGGVEQVVFAVAGQVIVSVTADDRRRPNHGKVPGET